MVKKKFSKSIKKSKATRNRNKKAKSTSKQSKFLAVKHKDYLTLLSSSANNKKRREKLIDIANCGEISAVSECVNNILKGTVPLTKRQITKLRRHRHALRNLSLHNFSFNKKKSILRQKGGIIGAILPLALSALGSIIPSLFGR